MSQAASDICFDTASHDVQAELLQQEVINRQRLATAVQQLLLDLPKQAAAAEERMLMAEYVKGYQLVSSSCLPVPDMTTCFSNDWVPGLSSRSVAVLLCHAAYCVSHVHVRAA